MTADPYVRFWLHAVESEGGLYDVCDDVAQAVLPAHLQADLHLPDLVSVTADPDAAEENDDAIFLAPGHPLLETMTTRVLMRGDVGHAYLPWPGSLPPTSETLLKRARADIDVEHGRIDLAASVRPVYRPFLRVGILVTYTLDDHFTEREEVWADAHTSIALDACANKRFRLSQAILTERPERRHPAQRVDVERTLRAAHAALLDRIAARSAELARQSRATVRDELARSEAYYAAAAASLERRRRSAALERVALLDKQSEAIAAERARRRHEIESKFRVSYALQPYRLHLVHVPALAVPIAIQRGRNNYPFELCWLLASAAFLPPVCPQCRAQARLIARRERLACSVCSVP